MITLLECIKQARWPDDGPLSILPGVDVSESKQRVAAKTAPHSLADVPGFPVKELAGLLGVPKALQAQVSGYLVQFFSWIIMVARIGG